MKKAVCLVALLAFAAVASANVQFFFTHGTADPWGLSGNDYFGTPVPGFDVFAPTSGTLSDWYYGGYLLKDQGTTAVLDDVPLTSAINPVVTLNPGEFAYIWIKFDETEATDDKVIGIENWGFQCGGSYDNVDLTSYYMNNNKRWEVDPNAADPFEQLTANPQQLVNVVQPGIVNKALNDSANLYSAGPVGVNYRHTALMGVVRCKEGCYGPLVGSLNNLYLYPTVPPRVTEFLNAIECVPEPASLLLLGLAGLILRRR